ncbi:hypothetical protein LC608_05750 [Nostoc sp. XA010]|uniref:hypothetical protein n=1 Tax=Nostoc sp. XA010 TaxID=2780407 RepID=UPI001E346CB9|nr:hypothetical protein [Nostoc sp. XA010]MCC5656490.1 hypothetical protein [Nostoc sp. XA010]
MNLTVKTYPNNTVPKLNYDVLIENQQDGGVSATVLGLPDFKGSGVTKEAVSKWDFSNPQLERF